MISVIVPNYNHAIYLEERLQSIINQTYKPSEIIFLDDDSNDNSIEIATSILHASNISYNIIKNNINSGNVFKQWIRGIKLAKYNIIWIAESDDVADINFLHNLIPIFEKSDIMIAYGRIKYIYENGLYLNHLDNYYDNLKYISWNESYHMSAYKLFTSDFAIKNIIPNVSGALFRKPELTCDECTRLYEYTFAGDWYFYYLISKGGSIAYDKNALSYFRLCQKSVSNSLLYTDVHIKEHTMIIEDICSEYQINHEIIQSHIENLSKYFPDKQLTLDYKINMKNILRICIISDCFNVGGGEKLPIILANSFKSMGHHIYYIIINNYDLKQNIKHLLRNDIPIYNISDIENFTEFIQNNHIDIINSHNISVEWYLFLKQYKISIPYIATLHGGYECTYQMWSNNTEFIMYIKNIVTYWLYLSRKNILSLIDYIPLSKMEKIYNAVNDIDNSLKVSRNDFCEQYNIDPNKFILVLCSRAIETKGWDIAIDIMTNLDNSFHLILIGDGDYLLTILSKANFYTNITIMGYSDNPIKYFNCFDLAILPSTYIGESFPLFILECMVSNLPVIATSIGENKDIIDDKEYPAGIIIDHMLNKYDLVMEFTKTILYMTTNKNVYSKMKLNTYEIANRYSLKKLSQKYIDIFMNIKNIYNV